MSTPSLFPVEDNALDVVQKAMAGLKADGISLDPDLEHQVAERLRRVQMVPDRERWLQWADALGLHGPSLLALAEAPEVPAPPLPEGWQQWVLPFGPYSVNCFKIPIAPDQCVLVDAGFDRSDFMQQIEQCTDHPVALLITHGHHDHIGALPELIRRFPHLRTYAMDPSLCRNTAALRSGDQFTLGSLRIRVWHTPGHAADGICYELEHLTDRCHAVAAGDTVYARSAGKIPHAYRESLELLKRDILSLPPDTLVLPGHGPVTTIADERQCNPFFADGSPKGIGKTAQR